LTARREAALGRLDGERLDLLVVGGGVVGAAVAARAAELGCRVGLVDRGDFASGTSSASSKLIHGGLRYLRMGDVRLVRGALRESEALAGWIAPHLVHRLRFVLPVYERGPYSRGTVRAALGLYRALSGSTDANAFVPPDVAHALVPSLRLDGLRTAGIYADAQTNDARLALANVRAAADAGAAVANYAEAVAIEHAGGEWRVGVADLATGTRLEVATRTVLNAAGPWVDAVRRLAEPAAGTSVRLSKGAHLVVPAPPGWQAAVTIPLDRSRVSFAVPWEGTLLLGTTDEAFEGDPAAVEVTAADEAAILAEAGRALEPGMLARGAILARFAGLRVLPARKGRTASARRETTIHRDSSGLVTVAGGKLTTYRRVAAAALQALSSQLDLGEVGVSPTPLPGAVDPARAAAAILDSWPALTSATAARLARTYGALAAEVLAPGQTEPALLEPLAPGVDVVGAEVVYARDQEWALTVEDVLRRRTTLSLGGRDTPEVVACVEELLARRVLAAR
jgi:glycerol-3-phosphate dehydrogenase